MYSLTEDSDDYYNSDGLKFLLPYVIFCTGALLLEFVNFTTLGYIASLKSRNRIETMLLHLIISNVFIIFVSIPLELFWNISIRWIPFRINGLCQITGFFDSFCIYLPCFIYMCIAIDSTRYLTESKSISGIDKQGKIMIFIAWTVAIILSILECFFNRAIDLSKNFKVCTHNFDNRTRFIYTSFVMIFMFFIPSLTMFICYMINYNKTKKSSQSAIANFQSRIVSIGRIERTNIFMMLIIMGIIFVICWLPFNIIALTDWFVGASDYRVFISSIIFAFTIVWLNPIISVYFIYQNRKNKNVIPSI